MSRLVSDVFTKRSGKADDPANELTVMGTNAAFASPSYYTYNKNGALTDLIEPSGTTKFAYNPAARVARIKWRDATASYFFYDGNVRPYALIANGTLNYFLWEGTDLVEELNAGGNTKDRHTHGASQIPGIGQLVQTFRPAETSANQRIYPVMDARGSITKWHKSDGTTVLASREYDAFGQIIPNSATGTWPNKFGYQGQYWMEILSGNGSQRLYLSDRPLYDPVDGRFLQNEPLLGRRPFAHYLYAMQNPVKFVDPLGLQEKELITFPECKGKKGDGCEGGSHECKCPKGYKLVSGGAIGCPDVCFLEDATLADIQNSNPFSSEQVRLIQEYLRQQTQEERIAARNPNRYDQYTTVGGYSLGSGWWPGDQISGGVQVIGGGVEIAGAFILLATPEPTMGTKVAAVGLGVHGADLFTTGWENLNKGTFKPTRFAKGGYDIGKGIGLGETGSQYLGMVFDIGPTVGSVIGALQRPSMPCVRPTPGARVLFGQRRISTRFSSGTSVETVAEELRAGLRSPTDIIVEVFVNEKGEWVAINNRSLAALSEAGMRPQSVWVRQFEGGLPGKIAYRLTQQPLIPNAPMPGPRIPVTPSQFDLRIIRVIEIPR